MDKERDRKNMIGELSKKNIFDVVKIGKENFIETGTETGRACLWASKHFNNIYSIEINPILYQECKYKFNDYKNIHLYFGDTLNELPRILEVCSTSRFFWLDAHYSGGNSDCGKIKIPLLEELEIIRNFNSKEDVIVIDDARLIGTNNGWENLSLEKLGENLHSINKDFIISIYNDTIVCATEKDYCNGMQDVYRVRWL